MKKRLIPILLVIMMLISILPVHAVEAAPTFVVASVVAEAGETVDVTISVKNNPGIASIKLSVTYDDSLTLNSITYNSTIGGMSQQPQTKDSPVTLNWFNGSADSHGDWVFATLSFTVNDNAAIGDYDVTVTYEADNVYNIAEENVTFAIENGKVEVICGHNNTTNVAAIPATCAQNGFTAGVYCNDCRTYISGHEEIERTGEHSDADETWNYDENGHWCQCACGFTYAKGTHNGGNATCTTKAVCDTCHVEYGTVDSSAHGQTEVRNASEASCNQEGYTGDTYCVDCGEMISAGSAIPATGKHIGGEATCMEQAVCEVCGTAYGELDADNHKYPSHFWPVEEATCTEPGYSGDAYCECGEIMWYGEVTPPNGHQDYDGDGICGECGERIICDQHTGGTATCTQQAVCEVCGTAYGELDADNHGETEIKGTVEPDCGNAGYTGDSYCVDCGVMVEQGSMVSATGAHTDTDGNELCDDCGAQMSKTEEPEEENPKTGDFSMMLIVALMVFSAMAVVCVCKKKYVA